MIVVDEQSDIISQDAFFYPVHKRFSCFQELCDATREHACNVEMIIINFGHGQIFRMSKDQLERAIHKLLAAIWGKNNTTRVFFSTLVPQPTNFRITSVAYLKFNHIITQVVEKLQQRGEIVTLMPSHLVFVKEEDYLDEKTGLFVHKYNFIADYDKKYFTKGKMNVAGWFILRNMWLKEIRLTGASEHECVMEDWRDHQMNVLELQQPSGQWKSPPSVLQMDQSFDRD